MEPEQLEKDRLQFENMLVEQRQILNDAQINCIKLEGVLEYIYGCLDKEKEGGTARNGEPVLGEREVVQNDLQKE